MRNKWWALLLAVFLLLSALVGCNKTATGGDEIIIGGLAPETGKLSVYGLGVKQGAELAIKEINEKGGILGKKIRFISLNEQGDETEALNAYRRLRDQEHIQALIGDVTSKPTMAVAMEAAKDRMPMITPSGTMEAITTAGPNVFRACFIDPVQGQAMASYAADALKVKSAAVIYDSDDDYSSGVKEAFVAECKAKGIEIVLEEGYISGTVDFKPQLTKIGQKAPEVLFVPVYYQDVALILKQSKEIGLSAIMMGGDGWDGVLETLKEEAGKADGGYFANQFFLGDPDEKVQKFIASYRAAYNKDPVSFAALGYDSAYILAAAIERAGGATDKDKINAELAKTDYKGVTGQIRFDEKRNPVKSIQVIKVVNGQYTQHDILKPEN